MADPTNDGAPPEKAEKSLLDEDGALSQDVRDEFKKRLHDLGAKLDQTQKADQQSASDEGSRGRGLAMAMRMGSEFVVAVLIGGAIGWYLDKWMGTTPLMLFLFVMFGFAAGTRNIIRAGRELEERHKKQQDKTTKTG